MILGVRPFNSFNVYPVVDSNAGLTYSMMPLAIRDDDAVRRLLDGVGQYLYLSFTFLLLADVAEDNDAAANRSVLIEKRTCLHGYPKAGRTLIVADKNFGFGDRFAGKRPCAGQFICGVGRLPVRFIAAADFRPGMGRVASHGDSQHRSGGTVADKESSIGIRYNHAFGKVVKGGAHNFQFIGNRLLRTLVKNTGHD